MTQSLYLILNAYLFIVNMQFAKYFISFYCAVYQGLGCIRLLSNSIQQMARRNGS
jgi:hypothetical protein